MSVQVKHADILIRYARHKFIIDILVWNKLETKSEIVKYNMYSNIQLLNIQALDSGGQYWQPMSNDLIVKIKYSNKLSKQQTFAVRHYDIANCRLTWPPL